MALLVQIFLAFTLAFQFPITQAQQLTAPEKYNQRVAVQPSLSDEIVTAQSEVEAAIEKRIKASPETVTLKYVREANVTDEQELLATKVLKIAIQTLKEPKVDLKAVAAIHWILEGEASYQKKDGTLVLPVVAKSAKAYEPVLGVLEKNFVERMVLGIIEISNQQKQNDKNGPEDNNTYATEQAQSKLKAEKSGKNSKKYSSTVAATKFSLTKILVRLKPGVQAGPQLVAQSRTAAPSVTGVRELRSKSIRAQLRNAPHNPNLRVQPSQIHSSPLQESLRERTMVVELEANANVEQTVEQLKQSGQYELVEKVGIIQQDSTPKKVGKGKPHSDVSHLLTKKPRPAAVSMEVLNSQGKLVGQNSTRQGGGSHALGSGLVSDALFFEQWGMDPGVVVNLGDYTTGMNAYSGWFWWGGSYSFAPIVAVIDSGIDYFHPDFFDEFGDSVVHCNFAGCGYDFTGFGDPNPDDETGHGTHVSGLIAAGGNNGTFGDFGTVGVAWNTSTKIFPLKFIDWTGSGDVDDAVDAIYHAVDSGAWIINASFGTYVYSQVLKDALAYAGNTQPYGVATIAAAGNENNNTDLSWKFHFPSGFNVDSILSVGGSNTSEHKWSGSNYGDCSVDLYAPAFDILSTYLLEPLEVYPDHEFLSGTSMAAGFVSGIAAQVLARFPLLTANELIYVLRRGVSPYGYFFDENLTGGKANLDMAIQWGFDINHGIQFVQPIYSQVDGFCVNGYTHDGTGFQTDFPTAPPSGGGGGGTCGGLGDQANNENAPWMFLAPFLFLLALWPVLRRRA